MTNLLFVAVGGALGSVSRYLLSLGVGPAKFPFATLLVNVCGSFLLGFIFAMSSKLSLSEPLRLGITVGFLGALTTFSTFSHETLQLFKEQGVGWALLNVGLNLILGLTAYFVAWHVFHSGDLSGS